MEPVNLTQSGPMNARPFENCDFVNVILPTNLSGLDEADVEQVKGIRKLLEEHRGAIEREIGAKFSFDENSSGPRWIIGPYQCNPQISEMGLTEPSGPQIFLDRQKRVLVTQGRTPAEVTETYSYLRSLNTFEGGTWNIQECASTDEAIDRIIREVRNSYPAFNLKNISWDDVCEAHIENVKRDSDPIPAMQCWLAELTDAHTWVRPFPPFAELPYDLYVNKGQGIFYNVPVDSKAWDLGVRPGHRLLDQDFEGWWSRTSASKHSKPWIVGKRVLSSKIGSPRYLRVRVSDDKVVEWEEEPLADRWNPAVTFKSLSDSVGYLKV